MQNANTKKDKIHMLNREIETTAGTCSKTQKYLRFQSHCFRKRKQAKVSQNRH